MSVQSLLGSITSVNTGQPQTMPADAHSDKPWTSGIFKHAVEGPVQVSATGCEGDKVANTVNHGGVDKAVCVYSHLHYGYWKQQLAIEDFPPGAFGENLTVDGFAEGDICIGDTLRIGEVMVQLSQPREPCWKLARRWQVKDLVLQVQQTGHTGWYFRVLTPGQIQAGDSIQLIERPHPQWTVTAANQVMFARPLHPDTAALTTLPELSESWRTALQNRLDREGETTR